MITRSESRKAKLAAPKSPEQKLWSLWSGGPMRNSLFKYLQLFIYAEILIFIVFLIITRLTTLISAQTDQIVANYDSSTLPPNNPGASAADSSQSILPPVNLRPKVHVNVRDWTSKLSEDIRAVGNRTNCIYKIRRFYENEGKAHQIDPVKLRDSVISQINILLSQHRDAVSNIVHEAELLAIRHNFTKNLKVNYTDVHRLRNELDPLPETSGFNFGQDPNNPLQPYNQQAVASGNLGSSGPGGTQGPQFTSINGGTPVPGPPEWQTPYKSIVMQMNKNFGEIPVNTSMSAVHLPLPIYPGLPEIMNGIAWTEKLDNVFKKNLANYAHVHHQYYGDRLGFLRTFPAHKWRIPRTDPDLFDARTRPWYVQGASCPKNVVILVDTSGSMTGLRREIAKGVVFEILDTLTSNDYFAVMRFSETVTPIGFPKCNIKRPKLSTEMDEYCRLQQQSAKMSHECQVYERQLFRSRQYLRDNPILLSNKNHFNNGQASNSNYSYLDDDSYQQSIVNVTHEIRDSFLLQATSRNIRYLKSNFSMPTYGIANFTHALMSAFELLQAYERTQDMGAQCNQAIMLITDGAIRSHEEIFNRYNYPNSPVHVFTYMIGREVGDITATKQMACNNRGYYTHVINLSEVREQVLKYLAVMARPLVLAKYHPISWTAAYGDETHQVLTDWVLEIKRREKARIMLNEERDRLNESMNSSDVINIEFTNIPEYDELPLVDEELKNRLICEDISNTQDDLNALEQSLHDELDPLGYNDLACHWTTRRADLLTSAVKPVFDQRNTTLIFERVLKKNIWTERETHMKNAQLLGIAAVDLRIADILKSIPSHLLGPNGYAILMGQNGFVMHHPELRALLEDPFDKQSKILKPYFNAVDLTHLEQVYHKDESDHVKRKMDDMKLFKLREAALRGQSGTDQFYVKRSVDCRRRLHIRQQVFHYTPIKDTPFSLMLALPSNYGLNRVSAKRELSPKVEQYFKPSSYDLWTVHPDYKYCEGKSLSKNSLAQATLELLSMVSKDPDSADSIFYDDLTSINYNLGGSTSQKIVCDKELFPSLLFDAEATFELPDMFCGSGMNCANQNSRGFFSSGAQMSDNFCSKSADEMRSSPVEFLRVFRNLNPPNQIESSLRTKLASIYGLEMSYVATRSGLTRVRVYDLSMRIKKLADLFIQRHNRAVDEAWYQRTVDWNMRFVEDATIITIPYNANIRLVAKLRQRITQRHPAINDTRSNCDPQLNMPDLPEEISNSTDQTAQPSSSISNQMQNDEPVADSADLANDDPAVEAGQQTTTMDPSAFSSNSYSLDDKIDYNEYSAYDFLDLLANSSVHVSATQSVIINGGSKQRSPVGVTGLLYDYATFARRFFNTTSLNIRVMDDKDQDEERAGAERKIDICPNGDCAQKCGYRNDTIDCLLVDNNGFIVVGEELPYIGRSLQTYDEKLMQSLVDKRVFYQINLTDYQAICARSAEQVAADQKAALAAASPANQQPLSQINSASSPSHLQRSFDVAGVLANVAASAVYMVSALYSLLFFRASLADLESVWTGEPLINWASLAGAQSAIANQSLLAMLPNKTYLRPCERTMQLYETRPIDPEKLGQDYPEYYETHCNCSGWYVYRAIPKTNLIMLIVNTTSACRRCEQPATTSPANNFIPVLAPVELSGAPIGPSAPPIAPAAAGNWTTTMGNQYIGGNKTQEDQVCAMLERDSQLYIPRSSPDTCYSYNPEEALIHLCGGSHTITLSGALVVLVLAVQLALLWARASNERNH